MQRFASIIDALEVYMVTLLECPNPTMIERFVKSMIVCFLSPYVII